MYKCAPSHSHVASTVAIDAEMSSKTQPENRDCKIDKDSSGSADCVETSNGTFSISISISDSNGAATGTIPDSHGVETSSGLFSVQKIHDRGFCWTLISASE